MAGVTATRGQAMQGEDHGLFVFRASRLEALLDPMMQLLKAAPPHEVLAPHEVIAAHPGMRRWLGRELARRAGPRGITANLRIELPSSWLDRLARELLGEEAIALRPYRRELLRWRIHARLRTLDDPQLTAWLDGDAATREQRGFQLADRLARLYSQYLVYRPDWLADWSAGRVKPADAGLLAPLWRELRREIGVPHRGERIVQLVGALGRSDEAAREPLHVFGIAQLAPAELAVFKAVAQRRMVALYVPDPCRAHWGGLRTPLAQLRERVETAPDAADTEGHFLDQGHPLLGAWGRMGQHFVLALDDIGARVDTRHFEDEGDARPRDRLAGVQESIRRFDASLIGEYAAAPRADASLRIHACHTRLRELEVLRDALLDARSVRPDLKPAQIVVMMPDIHAYLPLLPAVFGAPGRHEGPLPWHAADVAVAAAHPLFALLRRLLDLPQSRLSAPELADLLAAAPVARRFGLGESDVETIERWLQDSRAAWALDGAFRARFEVPAIAQHTHAWALDRMLAGYVLGHSDEARIVHLGEGDAVAPLAGIEGPQAEALGALDALLVELREWCVGAQRRRRASAWVEWLQARIDGMLRIDRSEAGEREALAQVQEMLRTIRAEPEDAGLDPEIEFALVCDILLEQLDGVAERQSFLLGGVTFCGMVPQRAIPFEVVAVLGLDEGSFPRDARDRSLDPMTRHRRLGDRDVRNDDRYLFLETLMSARWRLHLSHVGEGVHDGKPRNPAAPLAELIAALDAGGKGAGERPWWVRHPLQPFDRRYFDGSDEALFSFHRADAAMLETLGTAAAEAAPLVATRARRATPRAPEADTPIALASVLAYYRNPAQQVLRESLGLRLDALDEGRLRESEPLDARFEALDQVARSRFLELASEGQKEVEVEPPVDLRLRGLLPPGRGGESAWASEREKIQDLLALSAGHPLFAGGLPTAKSVPIDRRIQMRHGRGEWLLGGELARVYLKDKTHWLLEVQPGKAHGGEIRGRAEADVDFRVRIDLFLRWSLLRLQLSDERAPLRVALLLGGERDGFEAGFNAWDDRFTRAKAAGRKTLRADLERRIDGLLTFCNAALETPLWYFPRTSWVARAGDIEAARQVWIGGEYSLGERDYAPGYARLLAGDREFDEGADWRELQAHARHLESLISLADGGEGA